MYYSRPGLIIAFHGCEAAIRNKLLSNPDFIKKSEKPYDWLGHGMYFWENNIDRALEWAKDKKRRGEIDTPAVIGAVLDLGYCFDLSDSRFISMIKGSYSLLAQTYKDVGETLPQNRDIKTDHHKDKILRELDCKVIEFMHDQITNWVATDIQLKGYSEYSIRQEGYLPKAALHIPGLGSLKKRISNFLSETLTASKVFFFHDKKLTF